MAWYRNTVWMASRTGSLPRKLNDTLDTPPLHLGARQVLLDPARGVDEIDRVVVVLFNAGGHGEDVGVEDDVFGREAHLIHQDAVGALANFDLAREGVGLALFVKGHHHGGGAVALDQLGLVLEGFHAFFHARWS